MCEPVLTTPGLIASPDSWIEDEAVRQLEATAALPGMVRAVGMPDLHPGRGTPIGAAFLSRGILYPHLVGGDIGCGMALWQTNIGVAKLRLDKAVRKLAGLEEPWEGDGVARLMHHGVSAGLADSALGTIGGGNHFAELQAVATVHDRGRFEALGLDAKAAVLMVHSGSRGLGDAILSGHRARFGVAGLEEGEPAFTTYLARHDEAMTWAVVNREVIAERFLGRLGASGRRVLDICHNSVTPYDDGWLHRKGAAPADKGPVVIPGSRGAVSYLVAPIGDGDVALRSLAHGAGRKWTRSDARSRLAKRYTADTLTRTKLGSRVICEDKELIFEEAPEAYKDIESVIADLQSAGLISLIAACRPLITYKTRRI